MAAPASPLGLRSDDARPVGSLSIFDPVYLGIDEYGHPIHVPIIFRNFLIGGEPGAGKSSLLNNFVAHAALSLDCRLILLDGKRVELGLWKRVADVFVGPSPELAIRVLQRVQRMMDNRYEYLDWCERRKIDPGDAFNAYLLAVDELAYFSATAGDKNTQERFSTLLRDVVARGRAVGIMVVAATQRPSSDIIPTSLRDLFAWRFAGRCTTDSSSDIVLGHGWAAQGYTANTIDPTNQGAGYLIAEGGSPMLAKSAYLSDADIRRLRNHAERLRHEHGVMPAKLRLQPDLGRAA
ncbi:cell division protein FtsK [Dactylosporangium vinaceum]|uniref:FtsK/SpoIIIE domain-containing protein n=1 Tax=Dactylosporangium vinaceum TaxID=53362 RepID=A0ABV5MIK7_9ACTN|nr:FtsK/SpoIIIE domain-containing protein [Dactylosporangium vinaceum]UAB95152.1 cell division protein FtsK [Dactylosporangium vinaceum]